MTSWDSLASGIMGSFFKRQGRISSLFVQQSGDLNNITCFTNNRMKLLLACLNNIINLNNINQAIDALLANIVRTETFIRRTPSGTRISVRLKQFVVLQKFQNLLYIKVIGRFRGYCWAFLYL